jgi:hypothetical protein
MKNEDTSIATISQKITPEEFKASHDRLKLFVKKQLKKTDTGDEGDYGIIPFTKKMSLLKPGAEKLATLYGFVPSYEKLSEVENWAGGFVFYKYRCTLTHFATGKIVGDAIRSCNNKEKKHANKNVYDVANTIDAVAQKRALVAAIVMATNASDIFSADIPGEYEVEAPNKTTKREDDPRRAGLTTRLFANAKTRGWTDKWIHTAIMKKWKKESITELNNNQIEELYDFIITKYKEVPAGSAPELIKPPPAPTPEGDKKIIVDADVIVGTPPEVFCKGPKHDATKPETMVKTTAEHPWCSEDCKTAYWAKAKNNKRMDEFLKTGKLPAYKK